MHRSWRVPWPALLLAALVTGLHLVARAHAPTPRFWGDEGHYALLAREDARVGALSFVPGTFGFDHRPIFAARVYAHLVPDLFERLTRLNAVLLGLVVLTTYAQARILGLARPGALLAAALLGTFPWLGFHVHSLWPEILHALFSGAAWTFLLAFLRWRRLALLVPAGVATAYALFTKGALNPFVPLFALFVGVEEWRAAPGGNARRLSRALAAAGLYSATVLALLVPQLAHNSRAGHGASLAANRWWNLEVGLASEASVGEVNERYWSAATEPAERERLARERTLAELRARGPLHILSEQTQKLAALLFRKPSEFEASLHRELRWGDPPPAWIAALERPARLEWYAILGLGALGMALAGARSLRATDAACPGGWLLLFLFALGFVAALLLVPVKPRFALPLVPVLCLFAGLAFERLWSWIAERRGAASASATTPDPGRGARA